MHSDSTYGCKSYTLAPEVAASLRVPAIKYPDNKVPMAVALACCPEGVNCQMLADVEGALMLADVLALINETLKPKVFGCSKCDLTVSGVTQLYGSVNLSNHDTNPCKNRRFAHELG